MESDTQRGVGSSENGGEELSPMLTTVSLNNRGMDSVVVKAGALSTLGNIVHGTGQSTLHRTGVCFRAYRLGCRRSRPIAAIDRPKEKPYCFCHHQSRSALVTAMPSMARESSDIGL